MLPHGRLEDARRMGDSWLALDGWKMTGEIGPLSSSNFNHPKFSEVVDGGRGADLPRLKAHRRPSRPLVIPAQAGMTESLAG